MSDLIDLRAKIDIQTSQWLDAVSIATGLEKSEVVRNKLREIADREIHEATIICRVMRSEGGPAA